MEQMLINEKMNDWINEKLMCTFEWVDEWMSTKEWINEWMNYCFLFSLKGCLLLIWTLKENEYAWKLNVIEWIMDVNFNWMNGRMKE